MSGDDDLEPDLESKLSGTSPGDLEQAVKDTEKFTKSDLESQRREGKAKTGKTTNSIAQVLLWALCVGAVILILALIGLALKYLYYVYLDEQRTAEFVTAVVWTILVALSTLFFEHKIVDKD